ncbi:MAG: hypothetical protein MIO87_01830, partial [Methanomassiliicoccales archaeon]|nr:hypothetical protein [Methanomassiliicoccales archaeon]
RSFNGRGRPHPQFPRRTDGREKEGIVPCLDNKPLFCHFPIIPFIIEVSFIRTPADNNIIAAVNLKNGASDEARYDFDAGRPG